MAEEKVRTTITLPVELDRQLRESVPLRKRSAFIAEAVTKLLREAERGEAWDEAAGICSDEDYPHWRTPADVRRYIAESRDPANWRRPASDEG